MIIHTIVVPYDVYLASCLAPTSILFIQIDTHHCVGGLMLDGRPGAFETGGWFCVQYYSEVLLTDPLSGG